MHPETLERLEIAVSPVHEDALLNGIILGEGVGIELRHALRHLLVMFLVQFDAFQHLNVVVTEGDGVFQTGRSVFNSLLVKGIQVFRSRIQDHFREHGAQGVGHLVQQTVGHHPRRQTLQGFDEGVVALNLGIDAFYHLVVGRMVHPERPVLLGGRLARVCHVEGEIGILRIQHQRYLVAFLQHADKAVVLLDVPFLETRHDRLLFVVSQLQLAAEHPESL